MTYRIRNIGIAIALAVLAALLTLFYVTNYKRSVRQGEALVTVFVASRDIPSGTAGADVASRQWMTSREIARRNVVPGAISEPDQIDDLVATEPTFAGEQVSTRRFNPLQEQGIRAQLKGNVRAFQVPGDQFQLLAGTLKAGDHVDVVASVKIDPNKDIHATRIILRDVPVLEAPSQDTVQSKITSGPNSGFSAVLAVTDTQVQKLFHVMKHGDWSLQLRPVIKPADSPEAVEWVPSILTDGLRKGQLERFLNADANIRQLLQEGESQ